MNLVIFHPQYIDSGYLLRAQLLLQFCTDRFETLCFRFDALTELGAFMRTDFLCISVLRVASGPRVKLASCKVL